MYSREKKNSEKISVIHIKIFKKEQQKKKGIKTVQKLWYNIRDLTLFLIIFNLHRQTYIRTTYYGWLNGQTERQTIIQT